MEGFSDRSINDFQEYLQRHAPNRGCRLETLYRLDEEHCSVGFRARIVLKDACNGIFAERSWSSWHSTVKSARKEAAWLALRELQSEHARPHNDLAAPVVVHSTHYTGGGAPVREVFAPVIELPKQFLGSEAVFLEGVVTLPNRSSKLPHDTLNVINDVVLFDDDSEEENVIVAHHISDFPVNSGRLGEQYAAQWLASQLWVKRGSVVWANEQHDSGQEFDIICEPVGPKGRRFVEVKTHWRGFGRTCLSRNQLERFLKPDYMILVLGHFSNYFDDPSSAPMVRCICSNQITPQDDICTLFYKVESDLMYFVNGKNGKRTKFFEVDSDTKIKIVAKSATETEIEIKGETFSNVMKALEMIESVPVAAKFTIRCLEPKSVIENLKRECGVKIESKYVYLDDTLVITFKGKLRWVSNARSKFRLLFKETTFK